MLVPFTHLIVLRSFLCHSDLHLDMETNVHMMYLLSCGDRVCVSALAVLVQARAFSIRSLLYIFLPHCFCNCFKVHSMSWRFPCRYAHKCSAMFYFVCSHHAKVKLCHSSSQMTLVHNVVLSARVSLRKK